MMREKIFYYVALVVSFAICTWQASISNFYSTWFLVPLGLLAGLLSQKKAFTGSGWLPRTPKSSMQIEDEKLQQAGPQQAAVEDWELNLPDLNEGEKVGYLELAERCCSPESYRNLLPFFNSLKDYTGDEVYMTTLNYVIGHLDDLDINFIIRLDVSSGVEDLEGRIKHSLKENFDLELPLPTATEFSGDTAIAHDGVKEAFDAALREYGYQMGFIDTKSDEYIFVVHKTEDRNLVEELVQVIGYDYYEA